MHGIIGFFVIEDHILNTGNGLATRAYLDELWDMTLPTIVDALRTHSVNVSLFSVLYICYNSYNINEFVSFRHIAQMLHLY